MSRTQRIRLLSVRGRKRNDETLIDSVELGEDYDGEAVSPSFNAFGQPIGPALTNWKPPPLPTRETMEGRFSRLEPLNATVHAAALYAAFSEADGRSWTYLPYGPFLTFESFDTWLRAASHGTDPHFYAIVDLSTEKPAGLASYLRIAPAAGSIEVGHIHYSASLRKSPAATEAMYRMMRWAFSVGYRRYEWKCDSLNEASRRAALRLGLSYEGTFRQANVYKGRSRDTAWFAAIDSEWPQLRVAFESWLDPANFDEAGKQLIALSELTELVARLRTTTA